MDLLAACLREELDRREARVRSRSPTRHTPPSAEARPKPSQAPWLKSHTGAEPPCLLRWWERPSGSGASSSGPSGWRTSGPLEPTGGELNGEINMPHPEGASCSDDGESEVILEDVVDDDETTTTATTTELSPLGITSLTSTPAWVNSSSSSTSSSSAQSPCAEVSGPPELAQAGDSELARAGDSVLCVRSELHVPSGRARGDASEPAQGRDSVRLERHGLSGGDGPEPASAGATSYGGKSDWILFGVVMSSTPMWGTKPLWAVWLLWTPSMCPLVLVLGNAFFVENILGWLWRSSAGPAVSVYVVGAWCPLSTTSSWERGVRRSLCRCGRELLVVDEYTILHKMICFTQCAPVEADVVSTLQKKT